MKKTSTIIIALALIASVFASCGKTDSPGTTENALSAKTLPEIIELIYAQKDSGLRVQTLEIDSTDAANFKTYTGLDSADKVKEAAVSEALIGSQAYSLVLVRVNDEADAEQTATAMRDGINPRKWICVEADDMSVAYYKDIVMLIMLQSDFEDISSQQLIDAFSTVCGTEVTKVTQQVS